MSLSTVSATIQDPSGQVFANGTWQLIFKPSYSAPGLSTDGGVAFTKIYGGSLDGTGSFSQAVNRNDTIAPAGSLWSLIVAPNASGQAYSVDLNVNSAAFNASALINAVVTNIVIPATSVVRAYKDSEVIPTPLDGSIYFDTTLNVLKIWDNTGGVWLSLTPNEANPSFNNVLIGGTLGVTGNATLPNITGPVTISAGGLSRLIVDNSNYVNVFSRIQPIQPDPLGLFPLGNDLSLEVSGTADHHFKNNPLHVTATTSLVIGANPSITVSSSLQMSHAPGVVLVIEPGTANEEIVPLANWSIVNATTLNITAAKVHAQPYIISQQGSQFWAENSARVQIVGDPLYAFTQFWDNNGNKLFATPTNQSPWPNAGSMRFDTFISGNNGVNSDLLIRNALAASSIKIVNAAGTQNLLLMTDNGATGFFAGITAASVTANGSIVGNGNLFLNSGVMTALGYRPVTAGGSSLGSTALPFANVSLGNAATNNITLTGTSTAARTQTFQDATGTVPVTIASGTSTLTANATLAGPSSQAAITTVATNALTTDTIIWEYASAPGAGDALCHVSAYITAGNVNFVRSNPTAAAQNVSAIVINWRVVR